MNKKTLLLVIMIAAVGLTGCLREGVDTIALPFGKIPEGVIPQAIREQFEQYMPIYEGTTPPNITGEYLCKPDVLVFTSDDDFEPGDLFAPMYFAFENQTESGMATYRNRQASATAEAPEVYVVGSGNNFTAYFLSYETRTDDDGNVTATSKMSHIMSGTLTPEGIVNFRNSFIMLEKDDPSDLLMDVNEYRVFKDGDELVSYYNWTKSDPSEEWNFPLCVDKSATIK